jgi:hypothetical protein
LNVASNIGGSDILIFGYDVQYLRSGFLTKGFILEAPFPVDTHHVVGEGKFNFSGIQYF